MIVTEETEKLALNFLAKGPDTMGPVSSDEELAAALVFIELERRGLVNGNRSGDSVTWQLTDIGIEALL